MSNDSLTGYDRTIQEITGRPAADVFKIEEAVRRRVLFCRTLCHLTMEEFKAAVEKAERMLQSARVIQPRSSTKPIALTPIVYRQMMVLTGRPIRDLEPIGAAVREALQLWNVSAPTGAQFEWAVRSAERGLVLYGIIDGDVRAAKEAEPLGPMPTA